MNEDDEFDFDWDAGNYDAKPLPKLSEQIGSDRNILGKSNATENEYI